MSFFNSIFGKREASTTNINWTFLEDVSQLDSIIEASKTKPQAIFKHSTRCGISRGVLNRLEKTLEGVNDTELYFLDLLNHRAISSEIAQRFDVMHQSPQLLIIENGVVKTHASHYDILEIAVV